MPKDTRVMRAKRLLKEAIDSAPYARETASSRSTGVRAEYKIKAEAAESALRILEERAPRKS